ncbi:hypothetical protein EHW99_1837 [Erwinia amylovora]|uniref:Uncharacterized protein n=1 Tax=Erwinia amylovora (strain CFBP1430) TaxID=665029 RepID=D4I2J1_ERWAC|nr:hypothetical protein EaACW_1753 [Erwinia amylovora ACW56400]QJQ54541.1 hypothetical protein EHX00_1837 [Erwinia amylovora]CBA20697.1 hypothetical protein predicted by Glimmer/Critica [Erwinia amylovora CFBP1430]QJQ58239.1 hypothetical protein EHW99_1837 [Erwinia amylovora]QJQ61938.1 hypothetical protein EHW98_1837 [Erwinia amylovora]
MHNKIKICSGVEHYGVATVYLASNRLRTQILT